MADKLLDADGDSIKTVEDVQRHINPATNEPFTKEEARRWLNSTAPTTGEEV